jgi:multiple antibiotic resistance protein
MVEAYAVAVFVTLFAIINPLSNVAFFVALTEGFSRKEKADVARYALVVATIVLFGSAVIGKYVFGLYGLTVPAFRIAGGILVFKIGFDMVQGQRPKAKRTEEEREEALRREEVGAVPLGVPMHAGPGAISTVMILVADEPSAGHWLVILGSVVVTMLISFVLLMNADRIFRRLGRMGTMAFSRIMGLIITAVGVRVILLGLEQVLREWAVI